LILRAGGEEEERREERGCERLRHFRQTAVRSSHGLRTTQPVRAETNVKALRFAMGIAGAASLESWTSSSP
jgi:hypothetical protein